MLEEEEVDWSARDPKGRLLLGVIVLRISFWICLKNVTLTRKTTHKLIWNNMAGLIIELSI